MFYEIFAVAMLLMPGNAACGSWSGEYSAGGNGVYYQTMVCSWSPTGRKIWIRFVNRSSRRLSFDYKAVIGSESPCDSSAPNWTSFVTLDPGEKSEPDFTIDDPASGDRTRVCVTNLTYGRAIPGDRILSATLS